MHTEARRPQIRHDGRVRPSRLVLLLVILGACAAPRAPEAAQPQEEPPATTEAGTEQVAQALLRSAPTDWEPRMAAAWAAGARIVPQLVAGLRQDPDAPGAQAAIRLLGIFGGETAELFLRELLRERMRNATEAALALGEARANGSVLLLRETAVDRLADPTLRCAATASLVRLGAGQDVRTLVRAIVLAGTPAGESLRVEFGLPQRSRWALERYMLQRALVAASGQDFGFDTDSPWPDLERAADAIGAWLAAASTSR